MWNLATPFWMITLPEWRWPNGKNPFSFKKSKASRIWRPRRCTCCSGRPSERCRYFWVQSSCQWLCRPTLIVIFFSKIRSDEVMEYWILMDAKYYYKQRWFWKSGNNLVIMVYRALYIDKFTLAIWICVLVLIECNLTRLKKRLLLLVTQQTF